ncbi:MAG: NADH-quinone oxidoreductase subunit NuoE [Bacteroidales bacterium]
MDEQTIAILAKYPRGQRDCLIPILQDIQEEYGFLSETSVIEVGRHLELPSSKIFGLATFYNQFRFEPKGKYHIRLCNGTACHVSDSSTVLKELEKKLKIKPGQTTRDGMFSLELIACMGACHLSPMIQVNDNYHTKLDPAYIKDIVDSYIHGEE